MDKHNVFLFYLFIEFFWLSNEEIFNNPSKIELESNPVDYKIIYQSNTAEINTGTETITLNVINDFIKFPHNSYLLSQPLFVFIKEGDYKNLFLGDGYYNFEISPDNEIQTHQPKINLPSDISNIQFTDYIKLKEKSNYKKEIDNMCKIQGGEVIFYGKSGQ